MTQTQAGSLIELLDREQAPLLARRFYGGGVVSPVTGSLAQVPELLEVALPFIGIALGPVSLDARAKELGVLRTSALLECRYCDEHVHTTTEPALQGVPLGLLRLSPSGTRPVWPCRPSR